MLKEVCWGSRKLEAYEGVAYEEEEREEEEDVLGLPMLERRRRVVDGCSKRDEPRGLTERWSS